MFGGVFPNHYIQHPYQYYLNAELQYQQSHPTSLTNVFTTSQFAQPQSPDTSVMTDIRKKSSLATTPLATSSPPISRRSHSYAYHNRGYHSDNVQPTKYQKYSAPAQMTTYVGNITSEQRSTSSVPALPSPSQQLHDYENMRYSSQAISAQPQSSQLTSLALPSSAPPV